MKLEGIHEDPEHLGARLSLPPDFERLRPQLEPTLTPLPDPRAERENPGPTGDLLSDS